MERRYRGQEDEGEDSGDERGGRRGGFVRKPKVCQFCVDKVDVIVYKQFDVLRKLVSDRGKIRPRRQTGTCARHQRAVAHAIKQARHMALLPFSQEHAR